jgi:HPt (histidine-containing phosphotransfer) domain-containing protein
MVDHSHSAEAREALGEDAFAKLRARFMTEVDTLHDWLSTDASQDLLKIAEKSHKVAGSAAVFGADRLRESLKVIERAAREGDSSIVNTEVGGIKTIWTQTKTELLSDA